MNINTVPLATDFANLLAARRLFFGKGAQHETDYGRQRVARWIANVSAPLSGKIEVTGHVRRFIPEKLRSAEPIFICMVVDWFITLPRYSAPFKHPGAYQWTGDPRI